MRIEGWRGKGKKNVPRWRIEARKAKAIAITPNFTMSGQPRRKPVEAVSLPKLRCQEEPK